MDDGELRRCVNWVRTPSEFLTFIAYLCYECQTPKRSMCDLHKQTPCCDSILHPSTLSQKKKIVTFPTQHIYIYLPSYSFHSHNRNSNKKFETFIFIKRNTANSMMLDAIIIKHCPVCVTYNKIAYPSVDRAGCSIYAIVRWILCFQLAIIVAV